MLYLYIDGAFFWNFTVKTVGAVRAVSVLHSPGVAGIVAGRCRLVANGREGITMGRRVVCTAGLMLAITIAGVTACVSPTVSHEKDELGLSVVRNTGMDKVSVDLGVDFARYKSIAIDDLSFDRLKIVEPGRSAVNPATFKLSDKDKMRFRDAYREQLSKALEAKGGYAIVAGAAADRPDTLRVVTGLVRLEPNAPRDQDRTMYTSARGTTYSKGAGSMTLQSRLVDTATGKTVATLLDRITDTEMWQRNNSVTNYQAVRLGFARWAKMLRRQLDTLAARSE